MYAVAYEGLGVLLRQQNREQSLILRLFLLFLLSKSSTCACSCVNAVDRLSCSLDKSLKAIASSSCLFSNRSVRVPSAEISLERVVVDFCNSVWNLHINLEHRVSRLVSKSVFVRGLCSLFPGISSFGSTGSSAGKEASDEAF